MRILITGGTGFLGRATVRALAEAGHEVRAVVRGESRTAAIPSLDGVETLVADIGDRRAMAGAIQGMEGVVHAAAAYQYERDDGSAMAANAGICGAVLSAAGDAGVRRVVDVSSLVVFAAGHDPVDAATPLVHPGEAGWSDPYRRSKVEAEEVGRALEADGLPRVTVHPGTIIGPEDRGLGPSGRLVAAVLRGGSLPDTWSPWVDVRDVARAICLALDAPVGGRYLLTAGVPTHRALAEMLDELTGRHPRRIFVSPAMTRRLARLNDAAGGRLGPLPTANRLDFLLAAAHTFETGPATAELGLTFRPLRETVADTLRWWAANGVVDPKLAGRLAPSASGTIAA